MVFIPGTHTSEQGKNTLLSLRSFGLHSAYALLGKKELLLAYVSPYLGKRCKVPGDFGLE
jgi:hypothetical protein